VGEENGLLEIAKIAHCEFSIAQVDE